MSALAYLKQISVFRHLPPPVLDALSEATRMRILEPGDVLVRAGFPQESVAHLVEGRLAIYRRNRSRDVTLLLGILEAPALFGDAECMADSPWLASARAEEEACCLMIPKAAFITLIDNHPRLALSLYKDACLRHLLANHTAQTVALYDVETRLLRFLLDLTGLYGNREGNSAVLGRPVTQVDIAAALGVTRKTVQRAIKKLQEKRLLSKVDDGWMVHRLEELQETLPTSLLGLSSHLGSAALPVISRVLELDG